MFELLGGKSRPATDKPVPLQGFNFSSNKSTGTIATSVSNVNYGPMPSALGNYTKGLRTGTTRSAISPLTGFNQILQGDYTLELVFWGYSTDVTTRILNGSNWLLGSDSYFKYRYAIGNGQNSNVIAQLQTGNLSGHWNHLAVVRKNNRTRFYLNGTELAVTNVPAGNTMLNGGAIDNLSWNFTYLNINETSYPYDMLLTEFALHKAAIYDGNFTPVYPLV